MGKKKNKSASMQSGNTQPTAAPARDDPVKVVNIPVEAKGAAAAGAPLAASEQNAAVSSNGPSQGQGNQSGQVSGNQRKGQPAQQGSSNASKGHQGGQNQQMPRTENNVQQVQQVHGKGQPGGRMSGPGQYNSQRAADGDDNWRNKQSNGEQRPSNQKKFGKQHGNWGHVGGWAQKDNHGEKFTFFWSKDSKFSQHTHAPFMVDGISYNCAEQYMMYQKALMFGDKENALRIKSTEDPVKQKAYGREVRGFDEVIWDRKSLEIVKRGNYFKFTQNPDLYDLLMETRGTTLVEASPFDRKWGIGLDDKDPKAKARATWQGWNLLGEVLTELREELIKERMASNPKVPVGAAQHPIPDSKSASQGSSKPNQTAPPPAQLDPQIAQAQKDGRYHFFFSEKSPLSPHHVHPFQVGERLYNCVEQYVAQQKAALAGDKDKEEAIMTLDIPKQQVNLAKKVKVDAKLWEEKHAGLMKTAFEHKFKQIDECLEQLLATGDKIIVFASPYDKVFGIGLAEEKPDIWVKDKWQGKNKLGEILMQIRADLK